MTVKLEQAERALKYKTETMGDELRARREKYYTMLSNLQASQAEVRVAKDENERLKERVESQEKALESLERKRGGETRTVERLETLRKDDAESFAATQDRYKSEIATLASDKDALAKQLKEMSRTVMKVLEKHRAVEAENASLRLETQSRARETENARRRMLRETTLQGKLRIQAEMEHGALQAQFEHVHRDNVALRDELDLKTQELSSVQDTLAKSGKNAREMHIVASQTCQARYRKHLSLLDGMLQGKWGALSPQQGTEIELDFSAYGLGDEDMRGMISVLASWNSYWLRGCEDESASSAWTFRINLAENYFTDESIDAFAHLVALLNHRGCLDIRHNMFTHRGIRSLYERPQESKWRFCGSVLCPQIWSHRVF